MKAFLLFVTSILLFSCGTERIQLVKTDYQKPEVITVSKDDVIEVNVIENYVEDKHNEMREPVNNQDQIISASQISLDDKQELRDNPDDDETINKVKTALKAEHRARSSRNALITSTATLPLTILFPPIFLLSLIFFIIGAVKLSGANNARYITPDGERYISAAKIFLTISAVIITIIILLTAFLLVVFFL